jgi:N-acetylmuramoyl-L-alanine amidase
VLQAPFVVLMGAAMPAVVVESGFLNHPKEGHFVTSEEGQARIARGIADGILDFGRLVVAGRKARPGAAEPTDVPAVPVIP